MNDNAATNCEDVNNADVPASDYFREILLTYRLLFGLDERSWKSFSRILTTIEEQQLPVDTAVFWDPMLQTLCGKSAASEDAQSVYNALDISEAAPTYPCAEFPYFSKRILALQDYVKQHQPHNLRALWTDRRDVATWYNLWTNQVCFVMSLSSLTDLMNEIDSGSLRDDYDYLHVYVVYCSSMAIIARKAAIGARKPLRILVVSFSIKF